MNAEIIAVGTEILLGHIVNSNSAYLSRRLAAIGINVFYHSTVGDNPQRLSSAISTALKRSDVVITTGGLGPTVDDITVRIIAKTIQKKLVFDDAVAGRIKRHFKKRKIPMPKVNLRQAWVPQGAKTLKNDVGTAPGIVIGLKGKKTLIALPGPPRELNPMFERALIPFFKKSSPPGYIIRTRAIKLAGLPESAVCEKATDLLKIGPKTTVGIYAHEGQVDLKITAKAKNPAQAQRQIAPVENKIRGRLKDYIFGADDETLEGALGGLLLKNKKTLAVAESCTGGLIANRITNCPGSSKYFKMGVIAYSNEVKTNLLDVPPDIIKKFGAVSKPVAVKMAQSIRQIARADMGIAATGIAGPAGGTEKKPIGTVFIAVSTKNKTVCREYHFIGSRKSVKYQTSQTALNMAREYLLL